VLTTGVRRRQVEVDAASADLYAQAGARRHDPVRLRVEREPFQVVLARADDVPGYGWRRWAPRPLSSPVRAEDTALDNGLVRVEVSPADGTFSLNGLAGLDRLVDDGDEGDTYNYSPPAEDRVIDAPEGVTVEVEEAGPVRARLRVRRVFRWPARVVDGRRAGEEAVEITTRLELHAGERALRVTTTFDNTCRDHRLRAWFPLPEVATSSVAECAFGVVERGLSVEGGPHERALPTFPSRRFVRAGGLTVAHEGLLEYEVVEDGHALALTLLRATGMLSRDGMAYRPRPAGPAIPAEGAQLQGPHTVRYAVCVGPCDPYALVDDVFLPLQVVTAVGGGDRPTAGTALTVTGAEVSAVYRRGGALTARVFNPSDDEATVSLPGRAGEVVNLRGEIIEAFEGSFPLRPWGIATLRLAEAPTNRV
jgi:glycosyl hydrolase family 38